MWFIKTKYEKDYLYFVCRVRCWRGLQSCDDGETYAEQREKERDAISAFLNRDVVIRLSDGEELIHVGKINTISEGEFYAQDSTTNLERNEYVVFENTGVYMQIVRKGAGEKMKNGQQKRIICRYTEFNILKGFRADYEQFGLLADEPWHHGRDGYLRNLYRFIQYIQWMGVGRCISITVRKQCLPGGWFPLTYINIGRQINADEEIAKVRLIVPHSRGHSDASSNVYPCFYEITYQEMRN